MGFCFVGIAPLLPAQPNSGITEIRMTVEETTPPVPLGGPRFARVIQDEQDLVPGHIADGNLGDIVLQNDFLRAILTHPNRTTQLAGGGGALVDLIFRKFPQDGLDYIQTTADTMSSAGLVRYTSVETLELTGNTTPTVTLLGSAKPLESEPEVRVRTTYELQGDEPIIRITTRFTNSSTTQPTSILPGDLVDWGVLTGFIEGVGAVNNLGIHSTRFAAGLGDEQAVAFLSPDGSPLQVLVAPRLLVLQHWGRPQVPQEILDNLDPIAAAALRTGKSVPPVAEPEIVAPPPTIVPTPQLILPPPTETVLDAPAQVDSLVVPSATETLYQLPSVETPIGMEPNTAGTTETPGGGDDSKAQDNDPPVRLVLGPGESREFVRLLVISDRSMARIVTLQAQLAHQNHSQPIGAITGVVLNSTNAEPIPNADIFISGGPDFDETQNAPAFARLTSRADGTFGLRLPYGTYFVTGSRMGHQPLTGPVLAQVQTTSPLITIPIGMTGQSLVDLSVYNDPNTTGGTGQLLPAKITLIPKPGTAQPWFGLSEDVAQGSRHVFYLPRGQGQFPVSPGRYEMTISHGIEFDIVRGELTVGPNDRQSISINLPHSMYEVTRGMVSVDAGIMTKASPAGNINAESRVIQAVSEGVSVLVTGDYGVATDLQPIIERLGYQDRLKAFVGRRWLLSADGMTMDLFAYPLTPEIDRGMDEIVRRERAEGTSPDVILSDLRRAYPQVILQIDRPYDIDKGYLRSFEFDEFRQTYLSTNVPPPDFDAIQIIDGKRLDVQDWVLPRYYDLTRRRAAAEQGFLVAASGSNSRVGAYDEIGSMRTYLRTQRDTLPRFDADELTSAIRSGRYQVTNGPFIDLLALDPATGNFSARIGDLINCGTTETAIVRPMTYAAPWIGLNTITVEMDGVIADRTEVMPVTRALRYPVQARIETANKTRFLDSDTMITASANAFRRTLTPVLSPLPAVLGGDVIPYCKTGPIFVDFTGNGKILPRIKPDPETTSESAQTTP
jgi:hypothetical protein